MHRLHCTYLRRFSLLGQHILNGDAVCVKFFWNVRWLPSFENLKFLGPNTPKTFSGRLVRILLWLQRCVFQYLSLDSRVEIPRRGSRHHQTPQKRRIDWGAASKRQFYLLGTHHLEWLISSPCCALYNHGFHLSVHRKKDSFCGSNFVLQSLWRWHRSHADVFWLLFDRQYHEDSSIFYAEEGSRQTQRLDSRTSCCRIRSLLGRCHCLLHRTDNQGFHTTYESILQYNQLGVVLDVDRLPSM